MLKENKKMKASLIKSEKQRITKLAQISYNNDPRVKEHEKKIKQQHEQELKNRMEQRLREEREREERLIKIKLEREEQIRKQQEMLQKEKEQLHNTLISLIADNGIPLSKEDNFQIQLNGKIDVYKNSIAELEKVKHDKELFLKTFKQMASTNYGLKFVEQDNHSFIWNKEEIVSLQKAVKKFPAGTKNRWEKIAELVKSKPVNQIIQMAHILATNPNIKFDEEFVVN